MMEEFENALIKLCNDSPLPFECKRYVVLKFAHDVETTYQAEKIKRKKQAESEVAQSE